MTDDTFPVPSSTRFFITSGEEGEEPVSVHQVTMHGTAEIASGRTVVDALENTLEAVRDS